MKFAIHDISSAPEGSRPILKGARDGLGFVPNLFGTMAEAPSLLEAYTTISRIFDESSLSATERQIVLLTVSYENSCEYCVAAHTVISSMQSVPPSIVEAIRAGRPIDDRRLETLRRFTAAVVATRGWPAETMVRDFLAAGYNRAQVLEVVLGVGMKTLSNYTNHIASTPLDPAFAAAEWTRAA